VLPFQETLLFISFADPDPGSGGFLTPGSGMGKNQDPDPGSWMNMQDNFSESLETLFWGKKYLNSLMRIRIQDPGSGINIPDPQHYLKNVFLLNVSCEIC
jgi:hypothetical protein